MLTSESQPQPLEAAYDELATALSRLVVVKDITVFEYAIPECEPIGWLAMQAAGHRRYWADRDGVTQTAGVGVGLEFRMANESPHAFIHRIRRTLGDHDLAVYGGFAFQSDAAFDQDWQSFGAGWFTLNRFEVTRFGSDTRFRCHLFPGDDPAIVLDQLKHLSSADKHVADAAFDDTAPLATISQRYDEPNAEGWADGIREALGLFSNEVLDKIVLARKANFLCSEAMDPVHLMQRLIRATHSCYHFCFEPRPGLAFIGATPERLFRRRGDELLSEVVAGTRARGATASEDQALSDDLLESVKDQLEHDIVRKSIRQRLHQLCDHLEVDQQASILKLARKQHLYSAVRAKLRSDVSDGELVERLHPTPAVGGYPTENALAEIQRIEPFARGWYAAPVGCIRPASAEFAVGIRSALLHDQRLSLYSGAGIVKGSTPAEEWQEIEHKISDFIGVLTRSDAE